MQGKCTYLLYFHTGPKNMGSWVRVGKTTGHQGTDRTFCYGGPLTWWDLVSVCIAQDNGTSFLKMGISYITWADYRGPKCSACSRVREKPRGSTFLSTWWLTPSSDLCLNSPLKVSMVKCGAAPFALCLVVSLVLPQEAGTPEWGPPCHLDSFFPWGDIPRYNYIEWF